MKKNLLVILLCVLSVGAFAQKSKKPATTKKATSTTKKATGKTAGAKPNGGAGGVQQQAQGRADTTKVPQLPTKPFERPQDGYYKKTAILTARVTPYQPVREADVAMGKRIWEEIDLREKINTYMASPKARLIDIIMKAVADGELTAYNPNPNPDVAAEDPDGDAFSRAFTPEEAKMRLADSTLVTTRDKDNNPISSKMVAGEFNPDSILRFRLKEDWFFDKQRSVLEKRIIGLAPLYKPKSNGGDVDYIPAFWIHFPTARDLFAHKEIVVSDNDATGLSYDDAFMKRVFTGYIVKISNNKNERIKDYTQGIDKLYEAERIKKQQMDWELDLWQY